MRMHDYVVVIEGDDEGWSAWVPELPGCVAAGPGHAEVRERIREAIGLHVETLQEFGETVAQRLPIERHSPNDRIETVRAPALVSSQSSAS